MDKFSFLTIQKALEIAGRTPSGRKDLTGKIGERMYLKLCRLGFITEGATFEDGGRKAVWKRTNRANPFDVLNRPCTEDELSMAKALYKMGY